MKLKSLLLYTLLCFSACKSSHKGDNNKDQSPSLNGEWYKRYTGTIAQQPVVVNLHHYGGATAGTFYYLNSGIVIDLTESGDIVDNFNIHFSEFERTSRNADSDNYKPPHWSVNFNGKDVHGKWSSGDNSRIAPIDLKEDYPAGSYPLNVMIHGDSTSMRKGITNTEAVSTYALLKATAQMKKEDADFFNKTILGLLGADTLGAQNEEAYIEKEDKKYFRNYKRLLEDIKIDRESNEAWKYNFYHSRDIWVLCNDNDILSLQLHQYDYSGGSTGQGTYWSVYQCVDMQQKKVWPLNDIVNTDMLSSLLSQEARNVFKLSAKDTLSNTFKANTIPVTENVFITVSGITFCYYPGEIATDSYGEICLFIPYTRLKGILKDEFKKRMGL